MKKPVEIVLSSIHVGEARRVVTLGMDGRDHADRFLNQLDDTLIILAEAGP